ncbi:tRNA (adenosine(37)-N6)-dimethylallyltransferase MiaA [Oceanicola sp. 502str15]|uniref:tRNA (adenosine(37)-N6)-dimethylallyltransferase MiaA n=1 Tax=Oceanicola sp. 502str15 TaxID=2696061 RepID=UPI002094E306|nr:tRNA (adenosine(37)-N6)-dimethylallyltransferase MiaA [Oceanicola sp. 502str15]MCO6382012.1 tRNA (adenosine(37)-N6)-dimethylallyltransferase MiaA [Oceanicola sp. 502str15]
MIDWKSLDAERPVLIAGPTASGKSALALEIAARSGGRIINADALQVFANWRVLTARPSPQEEAQAPHALYGHVPGHESYSVGHWLRDIAPLLESGPRPIVVGGTGLYFTALTEGLAQIPEVPATLRAEADALPLPALLDALDETQKARIDCANRARVQRAFEVLRATGTPLWRWQDETPAPLLPRATAQPFLIDAPREWLTPRIERRFSQMLQAGALEEARANLPGWSPALPASKAIGAPELIAHLQGEISLEAAAERAKISTRQYAKRQRSWFRARMKTWQTLSAAAL